MPIDIIKDLTTTGGSALIPKEIDTVITELAYAETPLLKIFKEVPWDTNSYVWNERSALVEAQAYSETDSFSANTSTYNQLSVAIKMVKADGAVSNLLQKASKNYIDVLKNEIESATQSLAQKLEYLYIQGNSGLSSAQFDGLCNQISQSANCDGACISFEILDTAINKVIENNGKPGLILLSNRDLHYLYKLMRDNMTYNWEKVEVAAGVKLTQYRGIPLYGSSFIPTNLGASGTDSYGFVLDLSQIVVPVLLPITYEDMTDKVSTDSTAFRIKTYRALAVKGRSKKHCIIKNIGKPYAI